MLWYLTDTGCRNADAGGLDLDADAQLWLFGYKVFLNACINIREFMIHERTNEH
jgi:hypothetical protein